MFIRSIQLSDYVSVTQLLGNVLTKSCYEETMEVFSRQLSWDSDLMLVALDNHQVIGIIMGTIDNNNGYFYRIAVDPVHQRQGIGKSLIDNLEKRFHQRKVNKILITVDSHNEPLLPLYESLGYRTNDFFRSLKSLSIING